VVFKSIFLGFGYLPRCINSAGKGQQSLQFV